MVSEEEGEEPEGQAKEPLYDMWPGLVQSQMILGGSRFCPLYTCHDAARICSHSLVMSKREARRRVCISYLWDTHQNTKHDSS
jgi:hypothetical protein